MLGTAIATNMPSIKEPFEYTQIGSWACSADLETTYFSADMFRLLGLPVADTPPSTEAIGNAFAPADWARITELFDYSRRDKNTWTGEFRAILPDGSSRMLRIVGNPVPCASGDIVQFLCAAVDVTESHDSALQKAFDEIKTSETKLRRVIDTIPTLAWCNLADGPNEFLNKSWHEYTGLSPEESHGWGWQVVFHPDDLPPLMKRWGELLVSGEPGEIEARLRRHDGVYRWFLIRVAPFLDDEGKIVRWYGTSTDIEDRKWAEAASQAISSEMVLPELIKKLVRIAVEHAGAERGLLILFHGAEPRIEAEAITGPGRIDIAVRETDVAPSDLSQSVLNSVIRTQERVLLDDASADRVYSNDEYVRLKGSKSILCLPILKQAKLVGALYLENKLTSSAFTPDRVTVLLAELEELIGAEGNDRRIALDLKDLTLTGQDGIDFLARCEAAGITLVNCDPYVREWIARQRTGS